MNSCYIDYRVTTICDGLYCNLAVFFEKYGGIIEIVFGDNRHMTHKSNVLLPVYNIIRLEIITI